MNYDRFFIGVACFYYWIDAKKAGGFVWNLILCSSLVIPFCCLSKTL